MQTRNLKGRIVGTLLTLFLLLLPASISLEPTLNSSILGSLKVAMHSSIAFAQSAPQPGWWESFWAWNNNTNVFGIILRPILVVVSEIFINFGLLLLSISVNLFDTLVNVTIVQFGVFMSENVQDAIAVAWTAFRSIANILIIGFFTFIAINIILGSDEFGKKKLIARVLLVAILINFSLFFTKIVIDVSNYTATQFYNAGIGRTIQTTGSNATITDGIGQRLVKLTRTTSLMNSVRSLNNVGSTHGNWMMVVYAIFIFILLSGVSMILFYGSFILISRAILLIFLMTTAALAFSTYLLPGRFSERWWGTWWQSLIQSAVLAPLLMMLLWASLKISEALAQSGNGSLGDLIERPDNVSNVAVLFSFITILGLFFATFRIASSFSVKITGMNWASIAPALGIASLTRTTSFLGQRAALGASRGLNRAAGSIQSNSKLASLGRGTLSVAADRAAALSQRNLNVLRTPGVGDMVASQVKGTGLTKSALVGSNRPPSLQAQQSAANAIAKAAQTARAKTLQTPPPNATPATAPQKKLAPPTNPQAIAAPTTPPPPPPPTTPAKAPTPPQVTTAPQVTTVPRPAQITGPQKTTPSQPQPQPSPQPQNQNNQQSTPNQQQNAGNQPIITPPPTKPIITPPPKPAPTPTPTQPTSATEGRSAIGTVDTTAIEKTINKERQQQLAHEESTAAKAEESNTKTSAEVADTLAQRLQQTQTELQKENQQILRDTVIEQSKAGQQMTKEMGHEFGEAAKAAAEKTGEGIRATAKEIHGVAESTQAIAHDVAGTKTVEINKPVKFEETEQQKQTREIQAKIANAQSDSRERKEKDSAAVTSAQLTAHQATVKVEHLGDSATLSQQGGVAQSPQAAPSIAPTVRDMAPLQRQQTPDMVVPTHQQELNGMPIQDLIERIRKPQGSTPGSLREILRKQSTPNNSTQIPNQQNKKLDV